MTEQGRADAGSMIGILLVVIGLLDIALFHTGQTTYMAIDGLAILTGFVLVSRTKKRQS